MTLPFTLEQFLDVFAQYNRVLWPAAALLWIASAYVAVRIVRGAASSRAVALLLAAHWVWSGIAYHLVFFRSINPAATIFGALFIVQASLFVSWAMRARDGAFIPQRDAWSRVGMALMLYALAYPVLTLVSGFSFPHLPLFGVPCPTTLFTIGALLIGRELVPRWLAIIPLGWSAIGGSAAFLLGMHTDLALPVAGVALVASLLLPRLSHHEVGLPEHP
jgi:hypothetical protein